MNIGQLTTPALVVQRALLDRNLATMAAALPGARMRPHVKAHKCSALAARQAGMGHTGFTCATMAEMERLAGSGLGEDLLLANEVVDAARLGALAREGARITVAVDSDATIDAAAHAGVPAQPIGLPPPACIHTGVGRRSRRSTPRERLRQLLPR